MSCKKDIFKCPLIPFVESSIVAIKLSKLPPSSSVSLITIKVASVGLELLILFRFV